ncbi:hypothetical protein [Microbacterium sp. YJN-G]|uniref:hypothetical protein n=1 Tax=Microbacterium sp. YJN-G TaxID=2763257 RepID=UPI001878B202|nr:hypothetical protein [Microbacterium sp. YJN-G]
MAVNALSIDTLDAWLPIPLAFPEGPWRDADDWSDQVATVLPRGTGRAQFAQALRELQAVVPPLPGAQARMLWLGELERPQLAHVYVSPGSDEVDDLTALADAGLGFFVQTVTRTDVEGYDRAIHAVLTGDEQEPVVSARWIGDQSGMLVVVDLVTFEPGMLALAADDLRDLFQAVRLVTAPPD